MKHAFMDNTSFKAIHNLITLILIFFTHIHKVFAWQSARFNYLLSKESWWPCGLTLWQTREQHATLIFIYHTDFHQNFPLHVSSLRIIFQENNNNTKHAAIRRFNNTCYKDILLGSTHSTVQPSWFPLCAQWTPNNLTDSSYGTIIHFTCYTDHNDENGMI
jgi:hypothetical protein